MDNKEMDDEEVDNEDNIKIQVIELKLYILLIFYIGG